MPTTITGTDGVSQVQAGAVEQEDFASDALAFEGRLLHVRDEKGPTTNGGSSSVGDNTRDLNTVLTNEISGATLSSNQITLPSGVYYISASVPAYQSDRHRAFLYNVTDSSDELIGSSALAREVENHHNHSFIKGRFFISSSKTFEIRQYFQKQNSDVGYGISTQDGRSTVYTEVEIWKVG